MQSNKILLYLVFGVFGCQVAPNDNSELNRSDLCKLRLNPDLQVELKFKAPELCGDELTQIYSKREEFFSVYERFFKIHERMIEIVKTTEYSDRYYCELMSLAKEFETLDNLLLQSLPPDLVSVSLIDRYGCEMKEYLFSPAYLDIKIAFNFSLKNTSLLKQLYFTQKITVLLASDLNAATMGMDDKELKKNEMSKIDQDLKATFVNLTEKYDHLTKISIADQMGNFVYIERNCENYVSPSSVLMALLELKDTQDFSGMSLDAFNQLWDNPESVGSWTISQHERTP